MKTRIVRTKDENDRHVDYFDVMCDGTLLARITIDNILLDINIAFFDIYDKEVEQKINIKISNVDEFNETYINNFDDFNNMMVVNKVTKKHICFIDDEYYLPNEESITFGFIDNNGDLQNFIDIKEFETFSTEEWRQLNIVIKLLESNYFVYEIDFNSVETFVKKSKAKYKLKI